MLSESGWSKVEIKKTDGNWDNARILTFTEKLDIKINFPESKVFKPYYNELSMMQYIRQRRNDLAHGLITFEEGADNKTYEELKELADCTIQFMEFVVSGYITFINEKNYLKALV